MVEVKAKDHETVESLLRRFKRRVQESGDINEARRRQYFERSKSKLQLREEAKRKQMIRKKRAYLKKIGRIGPKKYYRS